MPRSRFLPLFLAWTVLVSGSPLAAQPPTVVPEPAPVERPGRPSETNSRERTEAEPENESDPETESESKERDEIETDRDSFTPAVSTAGPGRLIVESAYSFIDNRSVKETHSFPELLLRYGLIDGLELRLGWNYEVGGAGNETSGSGSGSEEDFFMPGRLERESNVAYGLKFQMNRQRNWIPASVVILQGGTPTSGPANDSQLTATYALGWQFLRRWKFDAAIRYRTDSEEEDHFNLWAPSAVLKVPLGERIAAHAEYFGIFSQGKEGDFVRHFISPGVHYLITDNLEVGVRVGWGLNDQSAPFFTNAGFGLRF
jgi:lipopolysaccharide assembly outer membrane protein LptD (OstA)